MDGGSGLWGGGGIEGDKPAEGMPSKRRKLHARLAPYEQTDAVRNIQTPPTTKLSNISTTFSPHTTTDSLMKRDQLQSVTVVMMVIGEEERKGSATDKEWRGRCRMRGWSVGLREREGGGYSREGIPRRRKPQQNWFLLRGLLKLHPPQKNDNNQLQRKIL